MTHCANVTDTGLSTGAHTHKAERNVSSLLLQREKGNIRHHWILFVAHFFSYINITQSSCEILCVLTE